MEPLCAKGMKLPANFGIKFTQWNQWFAEKLRATGLDSARGWFGRPSGVAELLAHRPRVYAIPGPRLRGTWGTHFLCCIERGGSRIVLSHPKRRSAFRMGHPFLEAGWGWGNQGSCDPTLAAKTNTPRGWGTRFRGGRKIPGPSATADEGPGEPSSALPLHELRELKKIAAGVVDHGDL